MIICINATDSSPTESTGPACVYIKHPTLCMQLQRKNRKCKRKKGTAIKRCHKKKIPCEPLSDYTKPMDLSVSMNQTFDEDASQTLS